MNLAIKQHCTLATCKGDAWPGGPTLAPELVLAQEATRLRLALEQLAVSRHGWVKDLRIHIDSVFSWKSSPGDFCDMVAQVVCYGVYLSQTIVQRKKEHSCRESLALLCEQGEILKSVFEPFCGNSVPSEVLEILEDLHLALAFFGPAQATQWGETVYFYEKFLCAYDSQKKKELGVYYTPPQVVKFMVESVNHLLRSCDASVFSRGIASDECYLLDPACGTGAFLLGAAECVREEMKDLSYSFLEEKIRASITGFEILPAAYIASHFHMEMFIQRHADSQRNFGRCSFYLSDTLDSSHRIFEAVCPGFQTREELFASQTPTRKSFPVVVGNPPYRQFSGNKGPWIDQLMKDYKTGLQEKKHSVDNDYVKFIRFAENIIENSGKGIVSYITPNGFLDAPTLRVMRQRLLTVFDEIYVLNLHGSSTVDAGFSGDENIFGIRQGVCITFFVKSGSSRKETSFGKLYYAEVSGSRENKLEILAKSRFQEIGWRPVVVCEGGFGFLPREKTSASERYRSFFSLVDIFRVRSSGIQTKNDDFVVAKDFSDLQSRLRALRELDESALLNCFPSLHGKSGWSLEEAQRHAVAIRDCEEGAIRPVLYRPFDERYTILTNRGTGLVGRSRFDVMKNLMPEYCENNVALITTRQLSSRYFSHAFVSGIPVDGNAISTRTREYNVVFPLWVNEGLLGVHHNFSEVAKCCVERHTGLSISPEELFGYVYGVLSAPSYGRLFFEDLREDFPRIPLLVKESCFSRVSACGSDLASLHKNWRAEISCDWVGQDSCSVREIAYDGVSQRLYLDKNSYFSGVRLDVLDVRVGSFAVLRKWIQQTANSCEGRLKMCELSLLGKILTVLVKTKEIQDTLDETLLSEGVF
jgi:predicted helicase